MAPMAPRVLFRERGSSKRSEAVTGSLVCGDAEGAGAAEVEVWARPRPSERQAKTHEVTTMSFTRILLNRLRERRTDCCTRQSQHDPPAKDNGVRRPALYLAYPSEADRSQDQRPDEENVQRRSHAVQKHGTGWDHEIARI